LLIIVGGNIHKTQFLCSKDAIFLSRADIGADAGATTATGAVRVAGVAAIIGVLFLDLLRIDLMRSLAADFVLGVLFCFCLARIFSMRLTDFY
tara:strand:+ start:55 stop:333 length:279 start_codon:yes stop_codon:yes gene_type:complete